MDICRLDNIVILFCQNIEPWIVFPFIILLLCVCVCLAIIEMHSFLQVIRIKYLFPDSELQNFALQIMEMLRAENSVDAHALVFFFQSNISFFDIFSFSLFSYVHLLR